MTKGHLSCRDTLYGMLRCLEGRFTVDGFLSGFLAGFAGFWRQYSGHMLTVVVQSGFSSNYALFVSCGYIYGYN